MCAGLFPLKLHVTTRKYTVICLVKYSCFSKDLELNCVVSVYGFNLYCYTALLCVSNKQSID